MRQDLENFDPQSLHRRLARARHSRGVFRAGRASPVAVEEEKRDRSYGDGHDATHGSSCMTLSG
ncbi:hypothetical protein ACFQX6_37425 [Streptosporangium lutulentum]